MGIATLALFVTGLVLLIAGAESLVRGAARLAVSIGISPLIIGLTVVAFGTSSPELAVSLRSALSGQADICLGNVVGSNIFNVLFILGVSALIAPLAISRRLIRFAVPVMIFVSFLILLFGLNGKINRLEGIMLFIGIITYTIILIFQSRKENAAVKIEYAHAYGEQSGKSAHHWFVNSGLIAAGLILLGIGSRWLVNGAMAIAQALGVSELIIGLTIVSVGTSLPEAATSVIASIRGERDIAVGNIIGSNIFNTLAVLGMSGIIAPQGIKVSITALKFDIPVMIAVAIACLPIFFTGKIITRWEGILFLGYYTAYITYLIMRSEQAGLLPLFNRAMVVFVIPLTAITFITVTLRALRTKRKDAE